MASIRKTGKKWQAIVRRRGHKTLSKSFLLKATAEKWARQQEIAFDTSVVDPGVKLGSSYLVADLLHRYELEVLPDKRAAEVTERYILRSLRKAAFSTLPLQKLTTEHIRGYAKERLKKIASSTLRRELTVLQHAINVAIRQWDFPLSGNPVANYIRPKEPESRKRRLGEGELTTLLQSVPCKANPDFAIVIQMAIETGMRRSELLSLRWEYVNLAKRTAYLPMTKNGSSRSIPLSSRAIELLSHCRQDSEGRIFRLNANSLNLSWQRLLKRAGIEDLHFHDLRHEAISRFFEMGLSMPEVALISGHKDHRMLLRYTHLRAEDISEKLSTLMCC